MAEPVEWSRWYNRVTCAALPSGRPQMSQEPLVYAINLAIAAILAAILTEYWRRAGRGSGLGVWAAVAWIMAVADLFFALRPWLPIWTARFLPTLLVTVGLGVLLTGAQHAAGRAQRPRAVAAITALHAVVLVAFLVVDSESPWRSAVNAVVWSGLSLAAFLTLHRADEPRRRTLAIPAAVCMAHGLFQAARVAVTVVHAFTPIDVVRDGFQVVADVEVSLFMSALFVSVLAAHLTSRNEELRRALDEVQELSGLLPLCAWCHKVRDGEGYWQQVERYFSTRSGLTFTHSICDTCLEQHFPDEAPTVTASVAPGA